MKLLIILCFAYNASFFQQLPSMDEPNVEYFTEPFARIKMTKNRSNHSPGFTDGLLSPLKSFEFLADHPELIRYLLIPWIITLICIGGVVTLAFAYVPDLFNLIWDKPASGWLQSLHTTLQILFWILTTILLMFVGYLVGQLLAPVAYSYLAERTRELITGDLPEQPGGLYADILLPIVSELIKIILFLAVQLTLLGLWLVPILGPILHFISSAFATLLWLALEYFDYVLDTEGNKLSVGSRLKYILANIQMTSGFAVTMFLILSVPVLNVFLLPMGVIGATRLHCQRSMDIKKEGKGG